MTELLIRKKLTKYFYTMAYEQSGEPVPGKKPSNQKNQPAAFERSRRKLFLQDHTQLTWPGENEWVSKGQQPPRMLPHPQHRGANPSQRSRRSTPFPTRSTTLTPQSRKSADTSRIIRHILLLR